MTQTGTAVDAAVQRFFRAVDLRDWESVERGLADSVRTDYTTLFGGAPETPARAELTDQWRALLPGFDATQHFLGPLVETADGVWECNVRGYHHLDGQTWMVAGWYVLSIVASDDGPVIDGITLRTSYETGSRDLVTAAQERLGSRSS